MRNADGSWADWPEKGRLQEWYGCMECNPYQQGWFVPHDVPGMVEIMGGRDKVLADLESFFENTPREFYWNPYIIMPMNPCTTCLSSSTAWGRRGSRSTGRV